ncbi:hypothetical protein L2E82_40256 [Cichorium intybus]|uniref:Uncharacterized protein n=1 Tax=Cichorium intybus TaxID=13427 RepID=A0ACB9AKV5_CICIN|nr:hypothetical protein L2E82_40256 [Cichorium intybus]
MSVVGFDIGNENCAIAVAKCGGIDVLLNDESKRETPAVVSFGEKQRFLGSAGAAFATTNPKSTISQIKRLIGRQYKEPSVQEDLKLLPFETSEGPRGGVLIHLEYLGKTWTFMPVEILGMFFAHLKQLTEKNLEFSILDCVIGIPSYFTDLQRREYLYAADIAGLRPLQLMHDCTAIALGYGMYKTDFFGDGPTNVVFVDIGHSDTQVTVAAFEKGEMAILSHSFDQHLGGRDFDEVLFRHFAAQFKEKYDIDVYSNTRASIRLMASCEKIKKVLSANTEATLSIDCLIDDKDVNGFITREEFENLSHELLNRVIVACCKAGEDPGLSVGEIHTIELVGSGSRIPAIMRKLTSLFGKEPMRTLNGSECVSRGCALRCAMLSPTFHVRDYKVRDFFPYSIGLFSDDAKNERRPEIMRFPKGTPFPRDHIIRYNGNTALYCQVLYTNKTDIPAGISPSVGHFMVSPSKNAGAQRVKGVVKVQLNIHGIVEIKPATKKASRKGWARRKNLTFSGNLDVAMTKDELKEAQEREQILTEQDINVEQTKEKRNTLESFIYDTRRKLSDPIENRYKDENARKEATKALQTCIQESRSAADLMPLSQKEEVINECIQAEKWLIHLTQLHDSLAKNATPIYCSHAISGITQALKRRCKVIMRSNPSLPKYDEPVDSD